MVIATSVEMFWPNTHNRETFQRVITLEALFQIVMLGTEYRSTMALTLLFMLFNTCVTYPMMHLNVTVRDIFLLIPSDIGVCFAAATLFFMTITLVCITFDEDISQMKTYVHLLNKVENGVLLIKEGDGANIQRDL